MRFEIAAAALIAGFAAAAPQAQGTAPAQGMVTSTIMVTDLVTITSCAETVTSCPARTETNIHAVTTVLPILSQITSTIMKTDVITITSCAATVTDCPARTSTTSYAVVTTIPVVGKPGLSTGTPNNAAASGNAPNGNQGTGSQTYHMPSATGYKGPSFTGAASSLNAGAALAGVGAVAALFL
ncbi:hypothetical protein MBLNU457_5130t1 [Dothideomycetes sp. NU457]